MTDPEFDAEASTAALTAVGEAIVGNAEHQDGWAALSLVATFGGGTESMFGYVYFDDGSWEARTPKGWDVLDGLGALREAMAVPGEPGWKACLLQLRRADLRLGIDVEYDDAERWKVRPDDLERSVERLRPA
ncbi:hypothetical protein [Actinomadura rifamycini]|uniref:hypothetical protein n=1 Tax=Actinomadura rifamycini TaxID=31962 RepID=UPI0004267BB8|nr:hypothetical protein [Actinomadura rifamycini]